MNEQTKKFLIIYQDMRFDESFTPERIQELVKSHVDNARNLDSKGVLFLCGLLKGHEKGMFILNAKTYEEAESYVLKDPFIINKVYNYVIYEIKEANADNNYLL